MPASSSDPPRIVITIDGPAGTGKSTVAHLLAKKLGLEFLDTGAMYRAAALIALEQGIVPDQGYDLGQAVDQADLHFDWKSDPPRLMLADRDVGKRIRDFDVSGIVSLVAAQPELRRVLVNQQRRIAQSHPRLVSEGRDQGSVVFPDADLKFYVHADVAVRANRRVAQLAAAGKSVDQARIKQDIQERDRLDASRSDGPLVRPTDAVDIDTGSRSAAEVVSAMEKIARQRLPHAGFRR